MAQKVLSPDKDLIISDVAPMGLGINIVQAVGQQLMLVYEPLMQPNTTIPFSVRREYSLMRADQNEVEIHLFQDHTGKARLPEETIDTGIQGSITDIPPGPDGNPHPISIEFTYDINGLAKLHASIPGTGKDVEIKYQAGQNRMADSEVDDARKRVQDLWKQNQKAKDYESFISKAERLMASMPQAERAPLSTIVDDLKSALERDNSAEIERLGNQLVEMIFEIENA
jgi:molecular chaperone DnaK